MENKGYIKLSRKFFENDIWKQARTYNDCEAWLDLIQSARFEASETLSRVGGREIKWSRGQYPASIRFLAKRWSWNERKVRSFLDSLKKRDMITTKCSGGMNIITLTNFEEYNCSTADTVNDTDNVLSNSELKALLTQLVTQPQMQFDTDNALSNSELSPKLTQTRHSVDTKNKKGNIKETTTSVVVKKSVDDEFSPTEKISKVKEIVLSTSFENSRNILCQQSGIIPDEFEKFALLVFEDWKCRLDDGKKCDVDVTHFRYQLPLTVLANRKNQKGAAKKSTNEWRRDIMQASYDEILKATQERNL